MGCPQTVVADLDTSAFLRHQTVKVSEVKEDKGFRASFCRHMLLKFVLLTVNSCSSDLFYVYMRVLKSIAFYFLIFFIMN